MNYLIIIITLRPFIQEQVNSHNKTWQSIRFSAQYIESQINADLWSQFVTDIKSITLQIINLFRYKEEEMWDFQSIKTRPHHA